MAKDEDDTGILGQIGDNDAKGVEDRMASGGVIPKGFYRVKLNGAKNVQAKDKEDGTPGNHGYELTFQIIGGPHDGRDITDKLWRSDKQAAKDRIKLFASRLGLIVKSADGGTYSYAEGKKEFLDCLDAEMVLEVIHDPDTKDPSKVWPRFAFGGAHDPADPKIVAIMKNGGQPLEKDAKPAATGGNSKPGAATTPAAKKRTTLDKL